MAGQSSDDGLQQRVCRVCQETYDYPVTAGLATRSYCEACAQLPARIRITFEKQSRRVKELSMQVDRLRQEIERQQDLGLAE